MISYDDLGVDNFRCAACDSNALKHLYAMADYQIFKCGICGTGMVKPQPSENILNSFYQGFLPELNREQIENKSILARVFFERMGSSVLSGNSFLDLGGGNGLFSYTFERYFFGTSTYIDRDPKSCNFVRNELKIERVFHGDANNISSLAGDRRYDIIYSRHMIEHLPDPFSVINMSIQLLQPNGIAIFQCPNGDSLEYLAYLNSNLWERFNTIKRSTDCSSIWLLWRFIMGDILHGIDPPRHLWAITKRGINAWAQRHGYTVDIFTAHLGDMPFSPGYIKKKGIRAHAEDIIGQKLLSTIRGGTHLIASFRQD
jgi:SAM-dependent methyltransferase